jgi:O-antigen/teichoic acid export membrane protein
MAPGSLRARFAQGAFWSLTANAISSALQLFSLIFVARFLGQHGFGELGIVTSTVQTLGVFAGLGLGLTATKHVAEWRARQPERAGKIIGLCTETGIIAAAASCALFYVLAPAISSTILKAPGLSGTLRLGCGLLFFNTLFGIQAGTLTGLEAFRTLVYVNLARGLIYVPASILGASAFGLSGAVGGMVVGTTIGWLASELAVYRECRLAGVTITWRGAWSEQRALWDFSVPALLASIIVFPVGWVGNAMLVRQRNGYDEMGIFNAANQWRLALVFIPAIINQVLLPILSDLHGAENSRQFRSLLRASLFLVLIISSIAAIPVLLFSRHILGAFGTGFTSGQSVLLLLVFAATLSNLVGPLGSALSSMGKMWVGFALNVIWACVFLVAAGQLVGKGAVGLGWAYAISYGVHLSTVTVYIMRFGSAPASPQLVSTSPAIPRVGVWDP